jgi:hypothetical protein
VLAYAATAVPATMDGGGVLYETKDPFAIARIMAAILDDGELEDRILATQDAALARLLERDFAGTLLRFVDRIRASAPRPAPEVPYDFWAMFDQAERLEELRQFRPAIFRALPMREARAASREEPTETSTSAGSAAPRASRLAPR